MLIHQRVGARVPSIAIYFINDKYNTRNISPVDNLCLYSNISVLVSLCIELVECGRSLRHGGFI